MCQAKVNVVTCEYIDLKIVPSPSLYMTNCSTAKLLLFFNNGHLSPFFIRGDCVYKIEKIVHVLPLEDESVESVEVKLVENFVEA